KNLYTFHVRKNEISPRKVSRTTKRGRRAARNEWALGLHSTGRRGPGDLPHGEWITLIVILGILHNTQTNLLQITHTTGAPGIFTGTGENREENGRKYCDYSNDN